MIELKVAPEDTFNLTLDGNQFGLLFAGLTSIVGQLEEDPEYEGSEALEEAQSLQTQLIHILISRQINLH